MRLQKIIEMIENTPRERWNDDQTIKEFIELLERELGKTYSNEQKKKYAGHIKKFVSDPKKRRLLPIMLKTGTFDHILKKL